MTSSPEVSAVLMLQEMGYEEVHNIGGILDYKGKVEL